MATNTDLSNLDRQVAQITGTGGFNIPIGTKAQRPKQAARGALRWNVTGNFIEYIDHQSNWQTILSKAQIEEQFVDKNNPVFNGDLDLQGNQIINVGTPTAPTNVVTLEYLEQRFTDGTGINAEFLGGHNQFYYATQFDLSDLRTEFEVVKTDLNNHIEDHDNPHQVTKAQVGLDRVDNTNDLEKPISNPTQAALDGKLSLAGGRMTSAANGGGGIDMNGTNFIGAGNLSGSVWYFPFPNPPAGFVEANGTVIPYVEPSSTTYSVYRQLSFKLTTFVGNVANAEFGYRCNADGTKNAAGTYVRLPDLRALFMRGWDHNRGMALDSELARYKPDTIQTHRHTVTDAGHGHTGTANPAGDHIHELKDGNGGQETDSLGSNKNFAARDYATNWINDSSVIKPSGNHTHTITVSNAQSNVTVTDPDPASGVRVSSETRPAHMSMLVCLML